eukprot:11205353-Lingulodinium_polyedra.AAC.1
MESTGPWGLSEKTGTTTVWPSPWPLSVCPSLPAFASAAASGLTMGIRGRSSSSSSSSSFSMQTTRSLEI